PATPENLRLDVKGGVYSGTLILAQGRWAIEVTTVATDALASTTQMVTVSVAYTGFAVEIGTTPKGRAWIQVFIDDKPYRPGSILANGARVVVVARQSVLINTGFERSTIVGVQGAAPSVLGGRATQGVWRIEKGKAPTRVR
ncbi:MAG: hypothetical protein LH650_07240, partial [Chloroflexi bacterium]|nr:hypothetical protein [Chloroflexota bacterium]